MDPRSRLLVVVVRAGWALNGTETVSSPTSTHLEKVVVVVVHLAQAPQFRGFCRGRRKRRAREVAAELCGLWLGSKRCVTQTGCRHWETLKDSRRRRTFTASVFRASRHEQKTIGDKTKSTEVWQCTVLPNHYNLGDLR